MYACGLCLCLRTSIWSMCFICQCLQCDTPVNTDDWNSQLMVCNIGSRNVTVMWTEDSDTDNAQYVVLYEDIIGDQLLRSSDLVSCVIQSYCVLPTDRYCVYIHVCMYVCWLLLGNQNFKGSYLEVKVTEVIMGCPG